ncbi:O-succinylbenzoic acid--CoA ligase [Dyadobacter koreensis]|uniref:O-succinylbenzoic acid--CoA ligase n=1 Tax=Dyadobacter koreensis TaxID=408657 RepID=A0A1H6XLI0_9BACT|nr:AMP-binding protein [Dyadobacter koreensis]SEJ29948.1 O-succinylbenzoic acid--CoA ligase [Dyadobacter koreensis]
MIWNTNSNLIKTQPVPDDPYARKAYDFMISWLAGKEVFILHTSGSTGIPKDIEIKRAQLRSSALLTGTALNLPKGTRALVCLNVNYIAGIMMLVRGMELEWELSIIIPSSNPLLEFENPGFDFVSMVPLQLSTILSDEKTKSKVNSLGKILLGGAPVNVSLQKQIDHLNVAVYQSYGMTETVSHIALKKLNNPVCENDYTVLPGVNFGVDDRGCIFLQGAVTNDDKIQTNDLVEITSENTFNWLGRVDNVINSGGVKVVLDKVDHVIAELFYESGYSNNFFSWYEKDEKLGQKLILIIQKNGQELPVLSLLEEIRKRISTYETPKHVYFVEEFIKTPTDKIDKRRTVYELLSH